MNVLLDVVTWVCFITGSFFAVVGGIGILRLPDFYSRLHGGGVTDTMGAGLILIGLMFQTPHHGDLLGTLKLIMILLFLLVTSPTSCHALAQAARHQGLKPLQKASPAE